MRKTCAFEQRIVVVIQFIDAADFITFGKWQLAGMKAHKTRDACND